MRFFNKKSNQETFISPMKGKLLPLSEVCDPVFSQKIMGDGFAIELMGHQVIAPLSGEIVTVFPTGHAYGLKTKDGIELLIHIGIDTVQFHGKGFTTKVKAGDQVKQGDVLVEVDLDFIKSNNVSLISPIIFTSKEQVTLLKCDALVDVLEKDIISYQ